MIWSICSTTNEEGRRKIDTFIREKEGAFPIKDTIYEYFVDVPNKCYQLWEAKLPYDWKYDPGYYTLNYASRDLLIYQQVRVF